MSGDVSSLADLGRSDAIEAFASALFERFREDAADVASRQVALADGDAKATWLQIFDFLAH